MDKDFKQHYSVEEAYKILEAHCKKPEIVSWDIFKDSEKFKANLRSVYHALDIVERAVNETCGYGVDL